jgi:hypothetical protein
LCRHVVVLSIWATGKNGHFVSSLLAPAEPKVIPRQDVLDGGRFDASAVKKKLSWRR